jgi:hypothetical protein
LLVLLLLWKISKLYSLVMCHEGTIPDFDGTSRVNHYALARKKSAILT